MKLLLTKQDRLKAHGIMDSIQLITGVDMDEIIKTNSRKREVVMLRHLSIYLIHKNTQWSYQTLAEYIGLSNHTSVMHALKKINQWIELPHYYKNEYSLLTQIETHHGEKCKDSI